MKEISKKKKEKKSYLRPKARRSRAINLFSECIYREYYPNKEEQEHQYLFPHFCGVFKKTEWLTRCLPGVVCLFTNKKQRKKFMKIPSLQRPLHAHIHSRVVLCEINLYILIHPHSVHFIMPFGQLVIGPPGSGKTTYCDGMHQFLSALGR